MKQQLQETTDFLIAKGFQNPEIGIVLGTGLGQLINEITIEHEVAYADIPHFPQATVEFHSGRLVYGTLSGKKVVVMSDAFIYMKDTINGRLPMELEPCIN